MMRARRGLDDMQKLCAGPGRLCEALAIDKGHDGLPLDERPFSVEAPSREVAIAVGPRIGITRGVETPWRFGLARSPYLEPALCGAGIRKPPHSRAMCAQDRIRQIVGIADRNELRVPSLEPIAPAWLLTWPAAIRHI